MMAPSDFGLDNDGAKVLVVDDMVANRSVLCRQLEMHRYNVVSVDSGEAALAFLQRAKPDIVLLDYMMPHMNGIEVLRALRSDARTAELPVIMVTARAESEATVEALDAGADDYVTKPIDFGVLRARIESHLAKRGSASDLQRCNAALDEGMTMRSLVLADMESELREEIERRKELEARLSKVASGAGSAVSAAIDPASEPAGSRAVHLQESPGAPPLRDPALDQKLRAIQTKFALVFESATKGGSPNLAQMFELNELIGGLVDD